jgi:cytochrome b6-f complex iron-sulfur subunit
MAERVQNAGEKDISRRRFLLWGWAVSILVLLGQSLGIVLSFIRPRAKAGTFGGKITVGKAEEFPVGSVTYVKDGRFYISHLERGFLAVYRKCPHLGCIVPWVEEDQLFNCPCHGALFNKRGEVLAGPSPRPLDLFLLEIVEEEIVVDTSAPMRRERFEESQLVS